MQNNILSHHLNEMFYLIHHLIEFRVWIYYTNQQTILTLHLILFQKIFLSDIYFNSFPKGYFLTFKNSNFL